MIKSLDEIQHPAIRECFRFMDVHNGIELHHDADLPARSGLGSSSSFTVGLLNSLHALKGRMISKHELAMKAIHVEQDLIGEHVGSQDQCCAAFGGFNRFSFTGHHDIRCQPMILPRTVNESLQEHLVLLFTGFSRTASEIANVQIKKTPYLLKELNEMEAMVDVAVGLLKRGIAGIEDFGRLLHESWLIKRSLTDKISNSELDDLYEKARQLGAIGGKLLGAGSGGFMLFFVPPDRKKTFIHSLDRFMHVPFRFETTGSQIVHYTNELEVNYHAAIGG